MLGEMSFRQIQERFANAIKVRDAKQVPWTKPMQIGRSGTSPTKSPGKRFHRSKAGKAMKALVAANNAKREREMALFRRGMIGACSKQYDFKEHRAAIRNAISVVFPEWWGKR